MTSLHFQAAALVAAPSYPNSVAWSEENLVAVATGHLVTILNPAMPSGPRGLINIPASKPFSIGVIERKGSSSSFPIKLSIDLLSGCLLPTSLSRDTGPCVRSISWSPVGLSPNSGCLLAVCTTQGCVKLYRMPFCEFSADWIEVVDVSDLLHSYLTSVTFGESAIVACEISAEQQSHFLDDQECADNVPISVLTKCKRRKHEALSIGKTKPDELKENISPQSIPLSACRSRTRKRITDSEIPLISAEEYASRNAMLSSLVVAWSPILHFSPEIGDVDGSNSSTDCSILAVGAKSGKISLWRIYGPKCYSITKGTESITASLIGLFEAHCSWVTVVSWALYIFDASKPQLLLATGSSDGSVKIWQAYSMELLKSSEVSRAPFSLSKEITTDDSVPVSALAVIMPLRAPHRLHLAIGKGSGLIEVWNCDISTGNFEKTGTYDAHDQIITGLAWAFDGNCLYSCSQDNSIRSWTLHGNLPSEAPIPSNTPGMKSSIDVPDVYNSCYGVALSSGNMVLAVARTLDAALLNPMYEQRALKAAVEFLWIGGQQLDNTSNICPDFDVKLFPGFPEKELANWESNILWSLNKYERLDKPLVTWDIVAALLAFKQSIPKYTKHIILKWLGLYVGESLGSSATVLSEVSKSIPKMTSCQLNLVNVITRHVALKELKAGKINVQQLDVEEMTFAEEEEKNSWMELIANAEMELRIRLVGFSFSLAFTRLCDSSTGSHKLGHWSPAGLAQMEQWVALNERTVKDNIKLLAEDIRKVKKSRLHSLSEYVVEERCTFCSALVPLESAEVATCQGVELGNKVGQRHKLARCAVSMRTCPAAPTWCCVSCQRRVSELVPRTLFTMRSYVSDFRSSIDSLAPKSLKPLCPFCGILLQRLLPGFLLSASPV